MGGAGKRKLWQELFDAGVDRINTDELDCLEKFLKQRPIRTKKWIIRIALFSGARCWERPVFCQHNSIQPYSCQPFSSSRRELWSSCLIVAEFTPEV